MCSNSQAAHATYMKHDANIPSASAERVSGCDVVEQPEDPCFWRKQEAWDPHPAADDMPFCHLAPWEQERQPQEI